MMDADQPLPCPHCDVTMRAVAARARTGYMLELDQCPQCGGIWCDRWELFPLAAEEAQRLDPVDAARLEAPIPSAKDPGRCPRCTCAMRRFRDAALPQDARVERCPVCDGMWLNRGELGRWKGHGQHRSPLSQKALDHLTDAIGGDASWATVRDLDGATRPGGEAAFDAGETRSAIRSGVIWIILRVLLRLLLRV